MKNEELKIVNSQEVNSETVSIGAPEAHEKVCSLLHCSLFTLRKCKAFTLAEVLITLGVIGVVAAMTIPTLIAKYQEKAAVTRVKQTYSILSQAFTNIIANEGTPDTWDLQSADEFRDLFAKYIKNVKKCDTAQGNCFPNETHSLYTDLVNHFNTDTYSSNMILSNGTALSFWLMPSIYNKSCSANVRGIPDGCWLAISFDINGIKKPNVTGKDTFKFYVHKTKLIASGDAAVTGDEKFSETCITGNGQGCTAWVIYNGNMDYLHCNDLSWNGKTKCD